MMDLSIKTELDNLAYTPGEVLRGELAWQLDALDEDEKGELRLFYYTSGKGSRDVETVKTIPVDLVSPSGSQKFEFQLPLQPYSFSGRLVSLIWALEFQLFKADETERLEFVLSPSGQEIDLYAHSTGELPSYSGFVIGR